MFLLLTFANAWAAEPNKEIQISTTQTNANAVEVLGADQLSGIELSFVYGLSDALGIGVSYNYGQIITNHSVGANNGYYDEYDDYYYEPEFDQFESDFTQHQLQLGPRYSYGFRDWLSLYGKAEGVVSYSSVYATPSLEDKNPNPEITGSAVSFGGIVAGGVTGSLSLGKDVPTLLLSFEIGYGLQSPAQYQSIGDLDLSGGYSAFGLGARF